MNDQEINVTIAEACGWTDVMESSHSETGLIGIESGTCPFLQDVPDYRNDLNAMHEAENYLSGHCSAWHAEEGSDGTVEEAYICNLREVLAQSAFDDWMMIGATARQRAEAFLRTIGKWKD